LASAADPLYRTVFVGREAELKQLQSAFDAAMSGQGGLVMVVGEPGIGKTAICQQLATYVSLRGGRTLVGHCYEEGSLSLPYLAFVEAMRTYVLARDPDGLKSDLGTGAADVARIVSEVRDRVAVELRDAGDPEDDRWRLLQSVTTFLRNAASVQPMVIVLEDLHWADRGTLDLLQHLSRNLQGARLVVVGTYRDVEVDRAHPLSGALAELRRSGTFLRVPLRGLTVDEVHRMYESLRGNEVPWAQAEAVHRQTEGNPLFIQEFLRYLVEEGYVLREGGRWVPAQGTVPGTGLPEGLRDVIGKRLSRLSEQCNRLLSVAAVIGRDFDLETLRVVGGLSEDELLSSIEEAVRVGVLEERSLPGAVRYRFAHAFFRQSLYEEMIAPRRLRLHQEVARALEAQYVARREEHAAELAEHYGQSTDRADLAKAVEYSELAAKRAMSVFAYAEAEGHYRRCLEVQEVLDPDDRERRFELLIALGEAILPQADGSRGVVQAEEAYAIAMSLQDGSRAARAALLGFECNMQQRIATDEFIDVNRVWTERADANAIEGTKYRVYADAYYGANLLARRQVTRAHVHLRRALTGARELADSSCYFMAAAYAFGRLLALRDMDLVEAAVEDLKHYERSGVRSRDLGECLFHLGLYHLRRGDRPAAEGFFRDLGELAERSRDAGLAAAEEDSQKFLQFLDGKLPELRASFAESLSGARFETLYIRLRCLEYLGDDTTTFLDALPGGGGRPVLAVRARILLQMGRIEEARAIITSTFEGVARDDDESAYALLVQVLELAVSLNDKELAAALAGRLGVLAERLDQGVSHSIGRSLGHSSRMLGRAEEARAYYLRALALCQPLRFRPEIALIRLDLAELLLEHYLDERAAAIEHLDFAISEFREMKMQPALERALRHRGLLKA
jgi:tetratricopeptide (TPR) repeat protein